MLTSKQRRRYVRHPIQVPLAVRPRNGTPGFLSTVGDISEGGVSFTSPVSLALGCVVDVELPVHDSRFVLAGTLAACTQVPEGAFRVGLSFVETGMSFKMKLAEQVLRIADLQQNLSRERGVAVSVEEAAKIWIERYAASFADLYPKP